MQWHCEVSGRRGEGGGGVKRQRVECKQGRIQRNASEEMSNDDWVEPTNVLGGLKLSAEGDFIY